VETSDNDMEWLLEMRPVAPAIEMS
jgi:hypothetical protein